MDAGQILHTPISELPLTENFYLRSKLMGYRKLDDIVRTPVEVLLRKEEFNYEWLGELSKFMSGQNLLHLLQPIPGSRSY